jgi:hypothetical protein
MATDLEPRTAATVPSDKSRGVALAMAILLGPFGGHRFYVGKTGSGILMLATLGGLGIWYLYDVILVASGSFRDADERLVSRWDPEHPELHTTIPQEVIEELEALRAELSELSERVDFAERLLAQPRNQDSTVRSDSSF